LSAREGIARADKPPVAPDPAGTFSPDACLSGKDHEVVCLYLEEVSFNLFEVKTTD
jgi:hypothetical protein